MRFQGFETFDVSDYCIWTEKFQKYEITSLLTNLQERLELQIGIYYEKKVWISH